MTSLREEAIQLNKNIALLIQEFVCSNHHEDNITDEVIAEVCFVLASNMAAHAGATLDYQSSMEEMIDSISNAAKSMIAGYFKHKKSMGN